jgi:hypothetical protein
MFPRAVASAALLGLATVAYSDQLVAKPLAPIRDNSFLLEEAYNQEPGVIQHISAFTRAKDGSWLYSFTEEWPVRGQRHQLSVTLPVANLSGERERRTGLGDAQLNYRFQLLGMGEGAVAIAPRLSLVTPSGNSVAGEGAGGWGYQLNLPVSAALARRLVTHWNAGLTHWGAAKDASGDHAAVSNYNLGASAIWLAHERLNLVLEASWTSVETVVGPGVTERETAAYVSPGLRWRHNFASGLEIVPGIAFPLGVGSRSGDNGVLLYLSFEHPLRAAGRPAS